MLASCSIGNHLVISFHNRFPTIIYFNFGKNQRAYEGGRETKDFVKFMTNPDDPNAAKADQKDEWLDIEGHEHINFLDDDTFDEFVKSKGKVLVMVYAPCKKKTLSFFFIFVSLF